MPMTVQSPLLHLNYPLNKPLLLEQAAEAKRGSGPFNELRPGQASRKPQLDFRIAYWDSPYIQQIMQDLGVVGKPRFYFLDANAKLDMHTDINTKCSVNMVLSENPVPVTFVDQDHFYEQALLNVQVPHAVFNGPTERILFKISIFNETFEEVAAKIRYKRS